MRLLIYGIYSDVHADAVAWALRRNGHQADIWVQANFPSKQEISVGSGDGMSPLNWNIKDFSVDIGSVPYDAVWYRRPAEPVIAPVVSQADRQMAFREAESLLRGLDYCIAPAANWVNQPLANRRASSKVVQLQAAAQCGLAFPPVLISNSPQEIRAFAKRHEALIYKPFHQASWVGCDARSLMTTRISLDELHCDASLSACPGIFQAFIEKDYEIRLTIMGDDHVAMKIGGYGNIAAATDWRPWGMTGAVKYEEARVSEDVLARCRALMQMLGIRFGCFDLVVDRQGGCFFLEVNPAGQFLWQETVMPELPLLERFCRFLLREAHCSDALPYPVSFTAFCANGDDGGCNSADHVETRNPFVYADA